MGDRMTMSQAPILVDFNRPGFVGKEMDYISRAVENGHISGDGEFSRRCQAILETVTGSPRVLLTTSCTHALEMAALLLDLRPGDEVIIPSFTFVSTVNAFALRGVRPVFADIPADPGHRAGPLCRGRLRDGSHHGSGIAARDRGC
jgi:dTDP-4-amino-4,6-dideoxygalactose transaminase